MPGPRAPTTVPGPRAAPATSLLRIGTGASATATLPATTLGRLGEGAVGPTPLPAAALATRLPRAFTLSPLGSVAIEGHHTKWEKSHAETSSAMLVSICVSFAASQGIRALCVFSGVVVSER